MAERTVAQIQDKIAQIKRHVDAADWEGHNTSHYAWQIRDLEHELWVLQNPELAAEQLDNQIKELTRQRDALRRKR